MGEEQTQAGWAFETLAIHAGQPPDVATGAVVPPISLATTFAQREVGVHQGYEYSRSGNPTRTAVEQQVAALEVALRLYQPFGTAMFVPIGPDARDEVAMRGALRARKFRCSYHVPVMHLDLRAWNPAQTLAAAKREARSARWLRDEVKVELVRNWDELRRLPAESGGPGTTELRRVRCPVLVLHGEDDVIADPAATRAWLSLQAKSRVTARFFPGMRHEVVNEIRRAEVYEALAQWLEQALPAS